MSFDIDVSDLRQFGTDLNTAAANLIQRIKPAIAKGAVNVKAGMRADMEASEHFGQVARSITYESSSGATYAQAQIGPLTEGATVGDLAHFAYFGGALGGGGTVRDPQAVLDEEEPRLIDAVSAILGDVL